MEKARPSLLVIVVDIQSLLNFALTKAGQTDMEALHKVIQDTVSAIAVFCSSYALMHRQNMLSVLTSQVISTSVIYPTPSDDSFIPELHTLSNKITTGITAAMADHMVRIGEQHLTDTTRGALSQSFSTALSIINRHKDVQSRILVLQFERDRNQNYNALMNSIFSAQKLNILVDALVLASFDSHLLQQACFLTGGLYLKHPDAEDLLQLLMTHFLADNSTRKVLALPQQKSVDFKASCHCHKRPVEFAYMCSVCLTLTCQPAEQCVVCATPARSSLTQVR